MPHATSPTPLGACTLGWDGSALTAFGLPGAEHRLPDEAPTPAPPPWIAALSARVQRHLAGHPPDFSDPPSDFTRVSKFHCAVLRATLPVKSDHTTTYGTIAATPGPPPGASRAVGTALGANPRR